MSQPLFKDEDCKEKHGFIQVMTEKPFYEPGEKIEGAVYLRITSELHGV